MLGGMTPSSRVVLVALTLVLLAVSPASAAHHRAHRPNLVVAAFDLNVSGRAISGTVTVQNIGTVAAPRSVTSVGGRLVPTPRLRPGRRTALVVATTLPAGATRLLLCVDVRHRVRELREGDNCQTYTVPASASTNVPSGPSAPAPANPGVHPSTGPVVF